MNWVGGSRSRLVIKNNAKKQREFFEKKKMQQKVRNLGIALPASTSGTSCRSLDLLTLFVVNQIAADKENKDPPNVAVLGSCKGSKHRRKKTVILPMSPCSPSQLSLAESQPQYSVQGMGRRKHLFSQGFRGQQLSPVLESAFSDNSASEYLPPIADPLSPFSSTSSVSSGQGIYPLVSLQQRSQTQSQPPPHCSPSPWDSSGLEPANFQPFSQPRGMTGNTPWSCGSVLPPYQLETPTPAQALFGGPEPDKAEVQAGHQVRFCLSQPEDKEPLLDFMLNQSETEQQFEDDVFRIFSNEEYEGKGSSKSKIYLKDETPVKSSAPQTVPESACMGVELSNCTYTDFSGPGHNTVPMNGCGYLPSYSCKGGYLSSGSDDDEECCQPSFHASASSYIDQSCADAPNLNGDSQEKPKQRPLQSRPVTPLIKPTFNFRDDQNMENVPCQDNTYGINSQQMENSTARRLSPQCLNPAQSCGVCKCIKTSSETRDAGTQTVPMNDTRDALTQCDIVTNGSGFSLYLPPVDVSVLHPTTGRQTDTATELNTPTVSSGNSKSGGKYTPWTKKSKDDSASGSSKFNNKIIIKTHTKSFFAGLSMMDRRGTENGAARGEPGQQENGSLMKDHSDEVREEVTSGTRVNRLSEKAETLQEIADILLLLKQRNIEG